MLKTLGVKMKRIITLLFLLSLLTSCDLFAPPEVEYRVDAGASVDITIEGEGGSTEQFTVSSLPWTKRFTAEKGDFVYVSAQVKTTSSWVSVSIKIDGDTLDDAYSQGDYVIATASGTAE